MEPLHLLALQVDPAWENAAQNRTHIADLLATQPMSTVDLLVLPEMFSTGFSMDAARLAEPTQGPTFQWMHELAQKYNLTLCGSLIIQEETSFFNRMLWVDPEGLRSVYDKRHLFAMGKEDRVYTAGTEQPIVTVKGWKLLPQICYDLRFPVWSRNQVDQEGNWRYDAAIYIASWPQKRVHHWEALLRARAIENQAFVIGVNRVGTDGNGIPYSGSSAVIHPGGEVLAEARGGEAFLHVSLSPEELAFNHRAFPFWKDADDFSLVP